MLTLKPCTEKQLKKFLAAYPNPLDRHVTMICDPPVVGFYDFAIPHPDGDGLGCMVARYWHDSRDDSKGGWQIAPRNFRPPDVKRQEDILVESARLSETLTLGAEQWKLVTCSQGADLVSARLQAGGWRQHFLSARGENGAVMLFVRKTS